MVTRLTLLMLTFTTCSLAIFRMEHDIPLFINYLLVLMLCAISEYSILAAIAQARVKYMPVGKKESKTQMMKNENDVSTMRLRSKNQSMTDRKNTEVSKIEDLQQVRILYVISQGGPPEEKPLINKQLSSKSSDVNEDVEILLKEMMHN